MERAARVYLLALVMAFALVEAEAGAASIKVLHINDHHSYIEGDKFKMNTSAVLTGIGEVEIRLGQVCFDAFALGNHEFDDGDAALSDFLTELAGTGCDTQVRACAGSHLACGRTNL